MDEGNIDRIARYKMEKESEFTWPDVLERGAAMFEEGEDEFDEEDFDLEEE